MNEIKLCRLCFNGNNLIDIFYSTKSCAGVNHLRTCILLYTGINILPEDDITKYVCKMCCDLVLNSFEFRKRAVANDRALKYLHQYISTNFPVDVEEIADLNELLFKNTDITVRIPNDDCSINLTKEEDDYAIHPSVRNILNTYKNIKLPSAAIKLNLDPLIVASKSWENDYLETINQSSISSDTNNSDGLNHLPQTAVINNSTLASNRSLPELHIIREVTYIPRKQQKRRKRPCLKYKTKKQKKDIVPLPISEKLSLLSLNDIIRSPYLVHQCSNNKTRDVFTFEMFLHPREVNFLTDLFKRYEDNIESNEPVEQNTHSATDFTVLGGNNTFVISNLFPQCFMYKIPIITQFGEVISVNIVNNELQTDNGLQKECASKKQLWQKNTVIDLSKKPDAV